MKQIIFSNWSLMRFLRLVMGIAILVQGIIVNDIMFVIAGILFTAMPVFNIGCCGAAGCAVPPVKKQETKNEIIYEEVV